MLRAGVGLMAVVALGAAVPGTSLLAQSGERGWIGISYEVRSSTDRGRRSTSVVITDVRRGSPAAEAGIREGDRLLRINELRGVQELGDLPQRLRLRAGDRVRIRVERGGRDLDFRLRAEERPAELRADRAFRLAAQGDSMAETMFRDMEQLRQQLVETTRRTVRTGSAPSVDVDLIAPAAGPRAAVGAPFEFFVFRGEAHDSLRREMEQLTDLIADLRTRERQRLSEVRRSRSGNDRGELRDEQLEALQGAIEDLTRQSAALRTAMAGAARATAGLDYALPDADPFPADVPDARVREYRPLTPYLLGSNRVAGAHVVDLRPQLAEYFSVDGGVLIVDVAPGTPAAIAGIVPGDVVTRLDQVSVRSVEDLRFGISQADETLPLTLIRRGNSVEVLLRR